jgi:hypothetical protein
MNGFRSRNESAAFQAAASSDTINGTPGGTLAITLFA